MAEDPPYEGLEAFVAARGDALLRTAALLMGGRSAGEDLLQAALERIMRRWRQIQGDPEGYLRRTLYHLAVDDWRQRSRRREVFADVEPPPHVTFQADLQWLPRTPENLAVLTLAPPPGFTRQDP